MQVGFIGAGNMAGALARGWGDSPTGDRTVWDVVESGPSPVADDEEAHAQRLIRS